MDVKAEEADEENTDEALGAQIPPPVWQSMQASGAIPTGVLQPPPILRPPEEVHPRQDFAQHGLQETQQPRAGPATAQRVPITSQSHQRPTSSGGPLSREIVIPPRPKPGRKPIPQEQAADKRRMQNRIAQRNFRDKRQQKLHEALIEIEQNKRDYEEEINERERQQHEFVQQQTEPLRRQLESVTKERDQFKKKYEAAMQRLGEPATQSAYSTDSQQRLTQLNTNVRPMNAFGASNQPTPPEDLEMDFTAQYARGAPPRSYSDAMRSTGSSENLGLDMGLGASDGGCGFCTDAYNCACAQQDSANSCAPAPGTCAECQRDPARAEMCKELANATRMTSRPSTSDGPRLFDAGPSGLADPTDMPTGPRMSCSNLIDQFGQLGERPSMIPELFGGQLRAYPASNGGYEFEEQEAAQVLHSLSRRNTMVTQPESNERSMNPPKSRRG